MDTRFLNVDELRQYMNIGRNKAYNLCKHKDFPSFRVGTKILIDKEKLDNVWIPKQQKKGVKNVGK